MPLIKRKPVLNTPLPSLNQILQPLPTSDPALDVLDRPDRVEDPPAPHWDPPDATTDEDQLGRLLSVFQEDFVIGERVKGKRAGVVKVTGVVKLPGLAPAVEAIPPDTLAVAEGGLVTETNSGDVLPSAEVTANGGGGAGVGTWRITDRECFYIPETGEIFTDYEYVLQLIRTR